MSFMSLLSGGRRTPVPPQPTAATAKPEAVHAHISKPSRKDSVGSLASAARGHGRPMRAQTDSGSYATPSSTTPSRSSTVDSVQKPFNPLMGKQGADASSAGLSPAVSQLSLVETIDGETAIHGAHSQPETSVVFPKAPASLEQEWMEVDQDSSDEDDFESDHDDDGTPIHKNDEKSSKSLHESVVLVEDEQVKVRRLKTELAAAQGQLSELQKQQATLKQHLENLEQENEVKAMQLKVMKETNDSDRIEAAREHASALESKRRELHDFQRSLEALQRGSKAWEEKVEMLAKENEVLRKEITGWEYQHRRGEEEADAMKREVEAANDALRSFKERSRGQIYKEREESAKLKERANDLRRQLETLERRSKESDEEIRQLRLHFESTQNALRATQAIVDGKDQALSEAQRQVASLEKERDGLHDKVVEMETEVVEARNSAQRLLAKAHEDHQYETSAGNERMQSLENELATYSSTIQQLRSSLRSSRAEAEGATKLAEGRSVEIERLKAQISLVEDELHSKEQDLIDAKASRLSYSHLEEKVRSLNVTIEHLKSDHAIDNHHLDVQITKEQARASQLEKDLTAAREKYRELRTRLEASEQSRRMLKDQLARREEESHNRRDSAGSSTGSLNLSSSIMQDPAQSPTDQVYNLLRNLNYEIFQTAALLADSLCSIPRTSTTSANANTNDLLDEETTSLLGPHLLSLVRSQSTTPLDTYDPYPLQTAIQATLICCTTRVMTAWYPGHWDHSDFLAATYTRIREAEGIAASDTWKAMTRARLRPTTSTVVRVVDFLEECLDTIFRFAGWPGVNTATAAGVSQADGGVVATVESLLRDHREKLSGLARHSLRLNVLLDSVNPALEPAFVEPGSVFDPYVMDRDDATTIGNNRAQDDEEDEEVVSTSEIGLRKVAPVDGKASSSSSGQRRRIVLRPKVILKSSFEA